MITRVCAVNYVPMSVGICLACVCLIGVTVVAVWYKQRAFEAQMLVSVWRVDADHLQPLRNSAVTHQLIALNLAVYNVRKLLELFISSIIVIIIISKATIKFFNCY